MESNDRRSIEGGGAIVTDQTMIERLQRAICQAESDAKMIWELSSKDRIARGLYPLPVSVYAPNMCAVIDAILNEKIK